MMTIITDQAPNVRFSIFPTGWWDEAEQQAKPRQRPQQTQTIEWVYRYIISERARGITEQLRAMGQATTKEQQQAQQTYKALNFEYATFSGIFSYRNARNCVARTPFLTIDIDHLGTEAAARTLQATLCQDPQLQTALCFVSPRGEGLKWIVELPEWTQGMPFKQQFEAVRRYVGFTYAVDPDKSGSDVCRACYLPWDAQCYVNPKYIV